MTTRRQFIKLVSASTGALVLGVRVSLGDEDVQEFVPNVWLRIETDGSIFIKVGKSEMGQGVRTSLPMIVAEELDADFADVRIEQASPGPDFKRLGTGGSGSIVGSWNPLRQAGAAAREMLVAAAAARWGVLPESCTTEKSAVSHKASNRRLPYRALVADASKQPVPATPRLKKPSEFRLIGTTQKRLDGPDIVTGKATYGIDVRLPGMLYAVVERPPVFGSKAESFDATETMKIRGVRRVVEISRGVAVVADNTWAAIKGRNALKVKWSESPHAGFSGSALVENLASLVEHPGITIRKDGDGRKGFGKAAKTLHAVFRYPWAAHASIEPVNCTVLVSEKECEIWSPTQTPNGVQAVAAERLGLPVTSVKVNVVLSGGAFGRRLNTDFDSEAIDIASALKGTPVHLLWTREDDMHHGHFQAPSVHRLSAGIDDKGKVVEWEHRKVSIPHNTRGAPTEQELNDAATVIGLAWGVYDTPYSWPSAEMTYKGVYAPTPIGPWRSVFAPSSVFARECFVDEVAAAAGRDPFELRLELLGADDPSIPKSFEMDGDLVERDRMRRVIELLRQKSDWGKKLPAGRALGFAATVHSGTYIAHVVEVSLAKQPRAGELPFKVHRVVCVIDCGIVINPDGVRQQVESGMMWGLSSMKGEMTFERGRAVEDNFHDFQVAMISETPPAIETHIMAWDAEMPNGLGEAVVDTIPPAVANALFKLAGKRIRSLPVRAADLA